MMWRTMTCSINWTDAIRASEDAEKKCRGEDLRFPPFGSSVPPSLSVFSSHLLQFCPNFRRKNNAALFSSSGSSVRHHHSLLLRSRPESSWLLQSSELNTSTPSCSSAKSKNLQRIRVHSPSSCGFFHSGKGMASSSVITPEDVLEMLMNDGTIDALRLKIINQLKANEELKSTTIKMAEQSKVLNTPGAEKQTKRELFDALRQELEAPILEKASKSVWDLILDNNGLGREISETVERVFCRLSGQEPPLFPTPSDEPQADNKELDNRKDQKGKGKERENENMNSNKTLKKRSFGEMNSEVDEITKRSSDSASVLEGSSKSPMPVSKS